MHLQGITQDPQGTSDDLPRNPKNPQACPGDPQGFPRAAPDPPGREQTQTKINIIKFASFEKDPTKSGKCELGIKSIIFQHSKSNCSDIEIDEQ